jgi:hypothetical protein
MLTDLRTSFSGRERPCSAREERERKVGMAGVEVDCANGGAGVVADPVGFDGVRTASFDAGYDDDGNRVPSEGVAMFLRPLGAGKSGRGEVGGGKDGRGMLTAMAGCYQPDLNDPVPSTSVTTRCTQSERSCTPQ